MSVFRATDTPLPRAERRISKDQVETVIASNNNGVWQPEHRTWKVCWAGTCVAINDAAEIVTVF